MKILMVYCNTPLDNTVPIGITQIISCLTLAGHNVELFDTTFYNQGFMASQELRMKALHFKPIKLRTLSNNLLDDFKKKVNIFNPDIIGFSVLEVTFLLFKKLLNSIEEEIGERNIKVAVGGGHAIFWPESISKITNVDYIAISEAEETFIELCNKIEKGIDCQEQSGFWIKTETGWRKNKQNKLIDLNTLAIAEPDVFGDKYLIKPMMGEFRKTITVEISRGCPYQCTYCAASYLNEKFNYLGAWYRKKSVDRLDEEYSFLINKYEPEFIYKFSETFLASNNAYLKKYFSMYKKYALPYWIESRPETVTNERVSWLKETNCIRFSMGLECGNERFRKKYLKRNYSNEQIIKATHIFRKYNISFSLNLIIGFPYETRKIVFDGIKILREAKPNSISTFLFTPYKGCYLRRICEDNGMIEKDFIGNDYFQMKYNLKNNFWGNDIIGLWRVIPLYVYLPEKRYSEIRKAEHLTSEGDKVFEVLKNEYYELKGWKLE
jgi:anaerobic magnesium-protoporphyrin IX monomethyl ester cyclase